ncbi:MAG: large subunit ribosomal protein [Solirubrobacterales bacterium]|jgi:ribosomal protein L22|nr:large subunit ribosomal protein [Solirubrobacterales bacterium]
MADEKKDKKDAKAPAAKKPAAKKEPKAKEAKSAKAEKKPAKTAAKKDQAKKAPAKKASKEAKGKDAKAKEPAKKEAKAKGEKKDAAPKAEKAAAKKAAPTQVKKAPVAPPVVRASARYVRIAPRKARLIADQVRGLHIEKARALLQFSPRGAAEDIHKLIDSAAANAENNHDLVGDEMLITSITVDEGPTLKRFRPRAQGRATPIHKRTSHIAVALTPAED